MLTYTNVIAATGGSMSQSDAELELAKGLDLARRWCGWHVTPELSETRRLNGRGGFSLRLPTLNLVELLEVVEEGVAIDLTKVDVSDDGRVVKWVDPYDFYWFDENRRPYWTERLGAIEVTMLHGYADVPAWDAAVLSYIKRTVVGQRTAVGPFQYAVPPLEDCSAFNSEEQMALGLYKLEPTT